ncbi:MAG TPA: maleylacetate reductase [Devosiaceae bacterium]|jgi:alcohol dehydrogenase class IV|nr:maleylacetate reductase [Devosiaceae bacterium]
MEAFVHEALPQRVVFGTGSMQQAGREIERLGASRALVLSTPGHAAEAEALAEALGTAAAGVFAGAVMHTPVEVTEQALQVLTEAGADVVVALGGGSTIGLGKALARRSGVRQIAIPTSYAGSEATPILGETAEGRKTTQRDLRVLPEAILYDPELTLGLPPAFSVTSGLNAIAHAVEALYAENRNPLIRLLALSGLEAMANALPRILDDPQARDARSDALYGAWACGTCLGSVGMALHHRICHVLGGSFGLPHAETHSVILPHAVAYNEAAANGLLAPVAELLGAPTAADGLHRLATRLGAPRSLRELGMPESGLGDAAEEIAASPYWNPRSVEQEAVRRLLQDAFGGQPPRAA